MAHPDLANVYYPNDIGAALFSRSASATAGSIDLQFKPTATLTLDFNAFYSKLKADNYNRNYMIWDAHFINNGAGQTPSPDTTSATARWCRRCQAKLHGCAGKQSQYGIYDQISRPSESSDSKFFDFDTKYRPMTS